MATMDAMASELLRVLMSTTYIYITLFCPQESIIIGTYWDITATLWELRVGIQKLSIEKPHMKPLDHRHPVTCSF